MNTIRRNQSSVTTWLALIIISAVLCLISPSTAEAAQVYYSVGQNTFDHKTPGVICTGAGTAAGGTGDVTPGLPPGWQADDIFLLFVESANQPLSAPSGWNIVTGSPQGTGTAGGASATALEVYWRRATSSESAPTVTDRGNHTYAVILAFRGVVTSGDPWDITSYGVEVTSDTSLDATGASTSIANDLVVIACARMNDSAATFFDLWANVDLSGLTETFDGGTDLGNGGGLGIATGTKASAGSYGTTTATLAASSVKGWMTIALKPAAQPPTLTISGGTATFSVGQTAPNMGVGDKVTYGGSNVAYISGKISSTQWTLVTATGGTPPDVGTSTAVNSIAHVFASLNAAVGDASPGAAGTSYLNTTNLVTGNYVLNVPCYYDTGADTTLVAISAWTTGLNNYIKIYTPANTLSECNQSQRHNGKWHDTKYQLYVSKTWGGVIGIDDATYKNTYIRIEGLQINNYGDKGSQPDGIQFLTVTGNNEVWIGNNILKATGTGTANMDCMGIDFWADLSAFTGTFKVWNNISYDWGVGIYLYNYGSWSGYIYNNTCVNNNTTGIWINGASGPAGSFRIINNLVQGIATNYDFLDMGVNTTYFTNLSQDGTSPNSAFRNKTVSFVGAGDYHLQSSDVEAREKGTDLSSDSYLPFSHDIDYEMRPYSTYWDIGADEYFYVPTVVELSSFTAKGKGNYVNVEWSTETEIDNLGFNLYRSSERDGTYTKLNGKLIPGLLSSVTGRKYTYKDSDVILGNPYYYKLEDIDLSGKKTIHGPISVDWEGAGVLGNQGTLISVSGFEGSTASRVQLNRLQAHWTEDRNQVRIAWQTGYEVANLGFHVYREENGKLYRLTPELVAGSALLVGSRTALTSGRGYIWWDFPSLTPQSSSLAPLKYWVEDVDLTGKRTLHGPVEPVLTSEPLLEKVRPEVLSDLRMRLQQRYRDFNRVRELRNRMGRGISTKDRGATGLWRETSTALLEASAPQVQTPQPERPMQWYLASSSSSIKLLVKTEGFYRVSQPELVAAGLSPGTNPQYLQLFVDGKQQPLQVTGEKDGRFDAQDYIEFYGTGLDEPWTDTRVYWLVTGGTPGQRMDVSHGAGGPSGDQSFTYTMDKKDRMIYFGALKNGDQNNFFGPTVSLERADQILNIRNLASSPPGNAQLEVALQGVTQAPHLVKISLNGTDIGNMAFEGQSRRSVEFTISQSLLNQGDNLVTLIAQGGEMDVSFLDYLKLTYWHTYSADEDALKFTALEGRQVSLKGFNKPEIRVLDITDPGAVKEVTGKVKPETVGYSITFKVPGTGKRTLLGLSEAKLKKPSGILADQPSSWNQVRGDYDLVIISHKDFLKALGPLRDLRKSEGLSVALIDVEDLYDEFNFGAKSPKALRDFLVHTKNQWRRPPRFVLLVGDSSFDPRNYLGFGDFDYMPTKFVDTTYLETASDDWFVDMDEDGLPDMAIGRLPVRSAEEATRVVSKIIGYGKQGMGKALLVADKTDEFDFEAASRSLTSLIPASIGFKEIFRSNFSTDAQAKDELLTSINQGPLLVNYIGHGSVEVWKGNILTSDDAYSLRNGLSLPFFVSMTCLNGFFQDLYTESLAEALLKADRGGALAVWTSSGLTEAQGQTTLDKQLLSLLFNGGSLTIGEATAKAKASVADMDIRKTWILFGDPSTRLK